MSLINDMLKNLEKNPRPFLHPEKLLEGLNPNFTRELHKNRSYYFFIILLSLIFIVICLYGAMLKPNVIPKTSAEKAPTLARAHDFLEQELPSITTNPSMLTGIALQMQHDMTNLRFLLNQNTLYRLSANTDKNEMTIIFENTQLLAALPKIDFAGSGIENIQAFTDENKNLKLVLSLNANADLKRLELSDTGHETELQMDIAYVSIPTLESTVKSMPISIKNPVTEEASEQQYQQALTLSAAGQNHKAIQILKVLLMQYPEQLKTRESLITLLMNTGNRSEAENMINAGLEQQADYTPFVELKARMLVDAGKNSAALRILEQSAPSLKSNPEYHAFIAAIYQRSGKYSLAAGLYKQLLAINPSNGKWWLGLGVTLEAMGNQSQALEAYANAENTGDFNPELKAYLASRLSHSVS